MTNDNFKNSSLLEIVEAFAADNNLPDSEEALSELFDSQYIEIIREQRLEDDKPALREMFNNWTDAMCKEGTIHDEQYSQYCYVGSIDMDD